MFDTMRKYLWVIKAISKLKLSTQKDVISRFLTAQKKYIPEEKTHADVSDVLKCALCPNMCRFDCPVLQAAKSETYSPAGRARIAYFMEMGRLTSEDAVNLMYVCAGCSACQKWCPFNFSVGDLLTGVRKDIAEKRLTPHFLVQFKEDVVKNHSIYENGVTSLKSELGKADVLYFAGCTTLNRTREIADSFMKILEKSGINCATLPEEWCCGAPLSILGFDTDFSKFAHHNAQIINEGEYKTVVCNCPECVYMFKKVYPEMGVEIKGDIMHTSEFLLNLAREEKITLKELKEEYVYHDPCVLSRKLHILDEPRELLKRSGVTLKEPFLTREDTQCCGMGGLLKVVNPEISLSITKRRHSQLEEACPSFVTACPTCKVAFQRVDDKILDVSEVVLKSMEK